ncbi:hypothetical protein ACFYXH_35990 [Streptomyces sp. NPDC002730]|uniref:hypothetical protein n=1 Tax=Streptomyces sp. NPDC002730 TaxID=3364662 RepID=UPI0036B88F70
MSKDWDAQVDGAGPTDAFVDLSELLLGSGEADLETFHLSRPPLPVGFLDAGEEVVTDLHEAMPLFRIRPQEGTSQAGVLMDAGGAEGSSAGPQGDLAPFEVAEELLPLLVGRHSVLFGGAEGSAAGDEGSVAVDDLLGIDRFVAHCRVDVLVAADELGDVGAAVHRCPSGSR